MSDVPSRWFRTEWRPPLRCRWFGCRFRETRWDIQVEPIIPLKSPLEVCVRCGGGRFYPLFGGYSYFTPDAVKRYIEKQEAKSIAKQVAKIPFAKR